MSSWQRKDGSLKHWKLYEGLSSPVNITWEVTNRCNLSCIHCLSNSGERSLFELTLEQCLRLIDQLASLNVFQVNFGGGEPFAREDFLSILAGCHRYGLVTCISTNATLIREEVLEFIRDSKLVYLQVSLDGASPETNDRIRGRGTFQRVIKTMELLSTRKIPFSINMVLTQLNYSDVSSLYTLARDFGAKLRVSRFRPSGRGKASWELLHLNREQLRSFSRWLSRHRDVVTGDSFFPLEEEERRGLGLNLCGAAKLTCCINPEGKVYPCAFLQDRSFEGGSLLNQSLGQIWSSAPGFTLLRNLKVKSCESCFRYDLCQGGCPAVAYFTHKTLDHPDPECLAQCIDMV